jgi:hypothetical protein
MYCDIVSDALHSLCGYDPITDPLILDMMISMFYVVGLSDARTPDGSIPSNEVLLEKGREYINTLRVRSLSRQDLLEVLSEVTCAGNLRPDYAYAKVYEPWAVIDMIAKILEAIDPHSTLTTQHATSLYNEKMCSRKRFGEQLSLPSAKRCKKM